MISDFLRDRIAKSDMGISEISRKSGMSESAIRSYRDGKSLPSVDSAEWILQTLGYEVELRKIEKAKT
ncbi:MAG: hypothetical protein IKU30_00990 [Clostridia bacterium]|nr:hypothetical protein [Clostridia bacterium]